MNKNVKLQLNTFDRLFKVFIEMKSPIILEYDFAGSLTSKHAEHLIT